jgi:uncharacterized protein (DUF1697 family)
MTRDYAAFLRNNRNPSMEPLRAALAELGLTEVGSFGATVNFVFRAPGADVALLERRITEAVGAEALVRTRQELAAIVAKDPYSGRQGANLFLARRLVDETSAVFQNAFGPKGDPPVASGTTVYFLHPTRLLGRKAVVNFERELGVMGTMRTTRVVSRVLELMDQ